jgi:8-oxo-dGTP diphosphatase
VELRMGLSPPKHMVVVLVLIKDDGAILLVRQGYGEQYWSLPGGVVEKHETLEEAAIREVKEETNLDIRLKRLVGLYSKEDEDALAITFEGEVVGGSLMASHEALECKFFPVTDLPGHSRDHLKGRVDDLLKGYSDAVYRSD